MIALRIAYDGSVLHGSQRQPHGMTVENRLLDALHAVGWSADSEKMSLRLVSRTDKGVSARENIAFIEGSADMLLTHNRLVRVQNLLDCVWVTGMADARYAPPYHKEYLHFLPPSIALDDRLEEGCAPFSGTHDSASFSKTNALKTTTRTITVTPRTVGQATALSLSGSGFLWQMCRRIAASCIAVCRGDMHIEQVRDLLDAPSGKKMPPAPAEHLLLYAVSSPILFSDVMAGAQAMKRYYAQRHAFWAPCVAHYATYL